MRCVDTSFCVGFLRVEEAAVDLAKRLELDGEQVILPSLVVVEFMPGPFARGGTALARSLALVARMTVVSVTSEIAVESARLGGESLAMGDPQDPVKLIVASTAISLECAVVTRDAAFSEMPGITVTGYSS